MTIKFPPRPTPHKCKNPNCHNLTTSRFYCEECHDKAWAEHLKELQEKARRERKGR